MYKSNKPNYFPYISDDTRDMLVATNLWLSAVKNTDYRINVVTGDRRGAGTDSYVFLEFFDMYGNKSPVIKPKTYLSNDHERASTTSVKVSDTQLGISPPFTAVKIWRDKFGNIPTTLFGKVSEYFFDGENKKGSSDWFLDRIEIEAVKKKNGRYYKENILLFDKNNKKLSNESVQPLSFCSSNNFLSDLPTFPKHVFPVQRWIDANEPCLIELYDTVLPNMDKRSQWRKEELARKRIDYRFKENIENGPMQAAYLPSDEKFSEEYYWNFATEKAKLLAKTKFLQWTTKPWRSIEELKTVMKKGLGETRQSMAHWNTDEWFGFQRLQGVNPYVLSLCKELPKNLDVREETVSGLLGDLSLEEALERNKIFICDLKILEGIPCKDGRKLASPIALFFLKNDDELLPVAIQLQQKKGYYNPVFTPKDDPSTWLVAKMYYNNAEAQHHQGISHLGLTHLLMEGICVCSHRQLSPSHPIFKLMAPHFLFLIAINTRGMEKLISPGGWVDCCMTQGVSGIFEVIRRGIKNHNFFKHGNVREEIEGRGLLDPEILPYYPYRDDAVSLYEAIRKYVTKVVHHYYDSEDKLRDDWELRRWRLELSQPRECGGVGLVGVPGNDETGFSNTEEVIDTVTIILSTCSLRHAAASFQQYEQFGFVPNYPGLLMKDPPTHKVTYTEKEFLALLPDMQTTLSTMVITKLLSSTGTNSLGNFEVQYLYHPTDIQAAEEFRKDLKILSLEYKKRNLNRKLLFDWLDPEIIPNSISI